MQPPALRTGDAVPVWWSAAGKRIVTRFGPVLATSTGGT